MTRLLKHPRVSKVITSFVLVNFILSGISFRNYAWANADKLRPNAAGKESEMKTELAGKLWEYGVPRGLIVSTGVSTDVRIVNAYARKAVVNLIGHQAMTNEDLDKAVREYIEISAEKSGEKELNPEFLVKRLIVLRDFLNFELNNEEFLLRLLDEVSKTVAESVSAGNIEDKDLLGDEQFLAELMKVHKSEAQREEKLKMARKIFISDTRWPVLLVGRRASEASLYSVGDPQSKEHQAVVAHSGTWVYEGSENIRGGARSNYFPFARLEGYAKRSQKGSAAFQEVVIHEFKDWVRGGHKDESREIMKQVNEVNREIDKELGLKGDLGYNQGYGDARGGLGREPSIYGPHPMQAGLRPLYEKISWARKNSNLEQFIIKNVYAFRDQKHGMAPVDAISFGIVLEDDTFIVQNAPVMGGLSAGGLEPDTHATIPEAIEFFNKNVSSRLKGLSIAQPDGITEMIVKIDEEFRKQSDDQTLPRFSYIGAELAVGTSMIPTIALAEILHTPVEVIINYRYNEYAMSHSLAKELRPLSLPVDFSVVWEGGKHGVAKNLPDLAKEGIIKDDSRFPERFKDPGLIKKGDKSILLAMVPPQELQILCLAPDYASAYDIGVKLTKTYQKLLKDKGIKTKYGAESGFTTEQIRTADGKLITLELVLGVLEQAVNSLEPDEAKYVRYALDIAASEMYIPEIDMYYIGPDAVKKVDPANVDGLVTNEQFTQYKLMLFKEHPRFISCEDWAADDQIAHWDPSAKSIMEKMIQMGDDLNVSRGDLILKHNGLGIQNAHLHKPNQISEEQASMNAVAVSHELENVVVWSHRGTRSPQETYTAQGAMGTGSFGSKFTLWGPGRSSLISIMNQADKLYRELGINVPYQGALALESDGPYKDYGWAKRLRVEIANDTKNPGYMPFIQTENAVYSVSGGSYFDKLVAEVLANAQKMSENPVLKVSVGRKSDNMAQVVWEFAGKMIRKNLGFKGNAALIVNDFNEKFAPVFEQKKFNLTKEADFQEALDLLNNWLEVSTITNISLKDELLTQIREAFSASQGTQKIDGKSYVFLVTPNVFEKGGMKNILAKAAELNGIVNIKFAFYGDNSGELKNILEIAEENIITSGDLSGLLKELANRNIDSANVIALITKEEQQEEDGAALTQAKIRQIVAPDITTLGAAKAIKELFGSFDFVRPAFNNFMEGILIKNKVIGSINSSEHEKIIGELKESVFFFPANLQPVQEVSEVIEEAVNDELYKKFVGKYL